MAPVCAYQPIQIVLKGCFCLAVCLGMAACSQAPPTIDPTTTTRSVLLLYQTPTPTPPSPSQIPVRTGKPTPEPPTPTPFTYTVVKGDTMLGIALKYGLKLEELMAANPEIDPRFLSINTVLVIPLGESSPPSLNTPTPVQVGLSEPVCYTTIDLGVWCFLLVENELDKPLENVSARIFLDLGSGSQVLEKNAFTPLNLVPPGEAMPVMVFFEPPAGKKYSPGAVLVSALPASDINSRYVRVNAKINQIDVDPGGLMAAVEGVISIPRNRKPAGLIRLAAIAYSLEEQVAGVRQIELPGPFTAGLDLPYSIEVFSLGPGISRLEVFAEASPLVDPGQATPTSQ